MSFATGAHCASLVAAGALGERILNQLVISLRSDYHSHPATARVANKDSFQNWHTMLSALGEWGVSTLM